MLFDRKTLLQRTYTTNKALFTTKQVQIIKKKDFIIAIIDTISEIFVVYITIRKWKKMLIYFKRQAQIKAQNGA